MSWEAWKGLSDTRLQVCEDHEMQLTLATVETGLTSVVPADCTPMKEKMKPRRRERMAVPTFMWNIVARMETHMMMLRRRPVTHHELGTRSATGVGSSSSSWSSPVLKKWRKLKSILNDEARSLRREGSELMNMSANCEDNRELNRLRLGWRVATYGVHQHHKNTGPKKPVAGRRRRDVLRGIRERECLVRHQREVVRYRNSNGKTVFNERRSDDTPRQDSTTH